MVEGTAAAAVIVAVGEVWGTMIRAGVGEVPVVNETAATAAAVAVVVVWGTMMRAGAGDATVVEKKAAAAAAAAAVAVRVVRDTMTRAGGTATVGKDTATAAVVGGVTKTRMGVGAAAVEEGETPAAAAATAVAGVGYTTIRAGAGTVTMGEETAATSLVAQPTPLHTHADTQLPRTTHHLPSLPHNSGFHPHTPITPCTPSLYPTSNSPHFSPPPPSPSPLSHPRWHMDSKD
jgi:hypothetical protein